MESIKHYLVIDSPIDTAYRAVTAQSGLAGWWTTQTVATPQGHFYSAEYQRQIEHGAPEPPG